MEIRRPAEVATKPGVFKGTALLGLNYQTKPNLGVSTALVKTTESADSTEEG
jgi:hypothetical protein